MTNLDQEIDVIMGSDLSSPEDLALAKDIVARYKEAERYVDSLGDYVKKMGDTRTSKTIYYQALISGDEATVQKCHLCKSILRRRESAKENAFYMPFFIREVEEFKSLTGISV